MKKILLFILISITILTAGNKKYALIYFEYHPSDLIIKVRPYANNEVINISEKSEHVIKNRCSQGKAEIFLAYDFPMEKNVNQYTYEIKFLKRYKFRGTESLISIYSLLVTVKENEIIARYEPVRAIPDNIKENNFSRTFKPYPGTKKYHLKLFNNDDFSLQSLFKKIYFNAKLYDRKNNILISLPRPDKVLISLQKLEKEKEGKYFESSKIDSTISLPLNQEVIVGLWPYKIGAFKSKRYNLVGFEHKGKIMLFEDDNTYNVIDFSEQWQNQVEQTLILEDANNYVDIFFDDKYFALEYIDKQGRMIKKSDAPVGIYLPDYYGKNIRLILTADTPEKNYLTSTLYEFSTEILSSDNNIKIAKMIVEKHPKLASIYKLSNQVLLKPPYKKSPFAIFTKPEGATVKYRRIYSIDPQITVPFQAAGDSPVFFQDFPYGLYECEIKWYENSAENKRIIKKRTIVFEFSDAPGKRDFFPVKKVTPDNNIRSITVGIKGKSYRGYYQNILDNYHETYYIQLKSIALHKSPDQISRKELSDLKQGIENTLTRIPKISRVRYGIKQRSGKYYLMVLLGPYTFKDADKDLNIIKEENPQAFTIKAGNTWKLIF